MKIGDKVRIYYMRYQKKIFFGIGSYLGEQTLLIRKTHGLLKQKGKMFKVNGKFIMDNACIYEEINNERKS